MFIYISGYKHHLYNDNKTMNWILRNLFNPILKKFSRLSFINISKDDVYSLDHTLSQVIYRCLLKYKEESGYSIGFVDDEDIPENVIINNEEDKWYAIVDEMIYVFELLYKEEQKDEYTERIENGLRLFSKYYSALWL